VELLSPLCHRRASYLSPIVVDLGDDDDVSVDELIIISSFVLLVPEDGPKPQAFRNVVSFIEKVMHLEPIIVQ
jgi:hypothetical protein